MIDWPDVRMVCFRLTFLIIMRIFVVEVKSEFKIIKWDESTIEQLSSTSKISNAIVEYALEGEISGKATVNYQMFYEYADIQNNLKSKAGYLGLLVISGSIRDKHGVFALRDEGTFENGVAASSLTILPNSGTDDFKLITGTGSYKASHTDSVLKLNISL